MICSVAPAKIILFGEHFVVKGKPAIATAIDLYAKTCIEGYDGFIIESKQLGRRYDLSKEGELGSIKQFTMIYRLIRELTGVNKGFYAIIDSEIPVAAGLGSSASTAVSFTHALLTFYGVDPSLDLVNKIAYEAEKVVHGKPSGIDNTVATYGGTIYYKRGYIERMNIDWPNNTYIVVVDTGISRNTGEVVRDVLMRYDRFPDIMGKIYDAAEEIVEEAKKNLLRKELETLGELINMNHGLLSSIGVSILETEKAVYSLRKAGALGAKISGAGRGGIVYGLFKEAPSHLRRRLARLDYRYYIVKPVNEGVRYR